MCSYRPHNPKPGNSHLHLLRELRLLALRRTTLRRVLLRLLLWLLLQVAARRAKLATLGRHRQVADE